MIYNTDDNISLMKRFEDLVEGIEALADERTGKRTVRTHAVKLKATPTISARELTKVGAGMNLSRGLFGRTNVRTLEDWEQGRARPNAQAALLIRLVQRDTVPRLAEI